MRFRFLVLVFQKWQSTNRISLFSLLATENIFSIAPEGFIETNFDWILYTIRDNFRRCSTWLGLSLAAVRTVSVRNTMNQKWGPIFHSFHLFFLQIQFRFPIEVRLPNRVLCHCHQLFFLCFLLSPIQNSKQRIAMDSAPGVRVFSAK